RRRDAEQPRKHVHDRRLRIEGEGRAYAREIGGELRRVAQQAALKERVVGAEVEAGQQVGTQRIGEVVRAESGLVRFLRSLEVPGQRRERQRQHLQLLRAFRVRDVGITALFQLRLEVGR